MSFLKRHTSLVGIDSDGCVFDSMRAKTLGYLLPQAVRVWGLEAISDIVMEEGWRINLRSRWRGRNRFTILLLLFERLAEMPEARAKAVIPPTASLRAYCESGAPLGNPSLQEAVAATGDNELRRALEWSRAVNDGIAAMPPVPAFGEALQTLPVLREKSDTLVVSQTPAETLEREWRAHGIRDCVSAVAGQEFGSKKEQLLAANGGRYAPGAMLMIGDAPGDMEAADEAGALFYPILPGREDDSWRALRSRDFDLFLSGRLDTSPHRREFLSVLGIHDAIRKQPDSPQGEKETK